VSLGFERRPQAQGRNDHCDGDEREEYKGDPLAIPAIVQRPRDHRAEHAPKQHDRKVQPQNPAVGGRSEVPQQEKRRKHANAVVAQAERDHEDDEQRPLTWRQAEGQQTEGLQREDPRRVSVLSSV